MRTIDAVVSDLVMTHPIWYRGATNVVGHGASRCVNGIRAETYTCALRTLPALPRRCLNPNHPRRMSGDRLSSHAPTCFREHHKRADRRHAGLTDTGFHQMMRALRKTRDATCQPGWVRNLHSHPQTISREVRSRGRNFAYAPMRRNSKVVSGLMTSPFISRSG